MSCGCGMFTNNNTRRSNRTSSSRRKTTKSNRTSRSNMRLSTNFKRGSLKGKRKKRPKKSSSKGIKYSKRLRGGNLASYRYHQNEGLLSRASDYPRNLPLTYVGNNNINNVSNPYNVSV